MTDGLDGGTTLLPGLIRFTGVTKMASSLVQMMDAMTGFLANKESQGGRRFGDLVINKGFRSEERACQTSTALTVDFKIIFQSKQTI